MNSEIERAFVDALAPMMAPILVVMRTATTLLEDGMGCVVVEAKDLEHPAGKFWRGTVAFTVDFPALAGADDQMPQVRAALALVVAWLEDRETVLSGWDSAAVSLLPGWHMGRMEAAHGGDRVTASVEITAGFRAV